MITEVSQCIQGCLKGERKAQNELYTVFAPKLFAVCMRYAGDMTEAEDILQDGFITIFTRLSSFRGEGSFEGWMKRIIINTALERFRKKRILYLSSETETTGYELTDSNYADLHLDADHLYYLIQKLPEGYRIVFNLFALEGFSHKEISHVLGITESTSKSQLSRARYALQSELKRLSHNEKIKMNGRKS
jgi:RNA polymerase sigma factor (sigma-70 family)